MKANSFTCQSLSSALGACLCLTAGAILVSPFARAQDGALDPNFMDPGLDDWVDGMALQPDGKIIIVGDFLTVDGQADVYVARLNPDGSEDKPSLGFTNGRTHSALVQPDGKIIVEGSFSDPGDGIARFLPDGNVDSGFAPTIDSGFLDAMALQADGKILVAGDFTGLSGQPRMNIGERESSGVVDSGFNPGANDRTSAIAVQPDGKILAGGNFTTLAGQARTGLGRLNADGSIDAGFNPVLQASFPPARVGQILVQPDGNIVFAGVFETVNGAPRQGVARLNADGSLDTGFNPPAFENPSFQTIALQGDGKVLLGGGIDPSSGPLRHTVTRLNTDGSMDSTWVDPNPQWWVEDLIVQPDGNILVGGGFSGSTAIAGQPRNYIARLLSSGGGDLWFDAVDLGGGWRRSVWFGNFNVNTVAPWIYHEEHGWIVPVADSQASVWFFAPGLDWIWSSNTVYPFLYRNNSNSWLYYGGVLGDGLRWFLDLNTGLWESYPAG